MHVGFTAARDTDAVIELPGDGEGPDLARLVEVLGPAVLRVLSTPGLQAVRVRQVVVYDVADPPVLRPGDVLLGVGLVATSDEACRVVRTAASAGVAAVVVRSNAGDLPQLRTAAFQSETTLIVLPAAMRWEQISVLIRHAITVVPQGPQSATATGDLFGFANILARAVGGEVTVEDPTNHVLAYSTLHVDELDEPRREAILGRKVPEAYLDHLHSCGVFQALHATDEVVQVAADERLGLRRRMVVAVRANGELLGSIWVQEGHIEFGPGAEGALAEASRIAPAHLIRAQSAGLTLRQRREDLLKGLVDGSADIGAAADALGFDAELPCAVIGIAVDSAGRLGADHPVVRRLDELLSARAMAFRWLVASVFSEGRLLVLIPELTGPRDQVEAGIERLARSLAADAQQAGLAVRVACGPVVGALGDVVGGTRRVDQILRLLSRDPSWGPVGTYDSARAAVAVGDVVAALAAVGSVRDGPVVRLLEYDRRRGSDYHRTLDTWLDSFGDNARAARALGIHPNTVRYRLQRVVELSGIRLDDPEERLIAMLHLRHVRRSAGYDAGAVRTDEKASGGSDPDRCP